MDKEKLKKVATAGTGGVGIVGIFFMLHGDIKAEIKTALDRIGKTEDKIIMLETQEIERDRRFIRTMDRIERKIDKINERLSE